MNEDKEKKDSNIKNVRRRRNLFLGRLKVAPGLTEKSPHFKLP